MLAPSMLLRVPAVAVGPEIAELEAVAPVEIAASGIGEFVPPIWTNAVFKTVLEHREPFNVSAV